MGERTNLPGGGEKDDELFTEDDPDGVDCTATAAVITAVLNAVLIIMEFRLPMEDEKDACVFTWKSLLLLLLLCAG